MYAGDRWYYQFQDTHTYVDWHDFVEDLPNSKKTIFLSNAKKVQNDARIPLTFGNDDKDETYLNLKTITKIPDLVRIISESGKPCFVVSSDKSRSKLLFDELVKS